MNTGTKYSCRIGKGNSPGKQNPVRLMEVCGGHDGNPQIRHSGIASANHPVAERSRCPVCVTGKSFIDKAIKLSEKDDVIITTYGDLLRVPARIQPWKRTGKER